MSEARGEFCLSGTWVIWRLKQDTLNHACDLRLPPSKSSHLISFLSVIFLFFGSCWMSEKPGWAVTINSQRSLMEALTIRFEESPWRGLTLPAFGGLPCYRLSESILYTMLVQQCTLSCGKIDASAALRLFSNKLPVWLCLVTFQCLFFWRHPILLLLLEVLCWLSLSRFCPPYTTHIAWGMCFIIKDSFSIVGYFYTRIAAFAILIWSSRWLVIVWMTEPLLQWPESLK